MKFRFKATSRVAPALVVATTAVVYVITARQPKAVHGVAAASPDKYVEIDWPLLRSLDYKTGETSPHLAKLDGGFVKIPGFVVPLDDDGAGRRDFLLVPSPQACRVSAPRSSTPAGSRCSRGASTPAAAAGGPFTGRRH